jgi:hypothetical protein
VIIANAGIRILRKRFRTNIAEVISIIVDVSIARLGAVCRVAAKIAEGVAVQVEVLEAGDGATSSEYRHNHREREKKYEELGVFHWFIPFHI